MIESILNRIRPLIPRSLFAALQRPYHFALAFLAALAYGFPSRRLRVIAVTGTKGKSSTTEILNAILEAAGKKTALSNTIRFKVGDASERNLYKMSTPGRFAMQKLLRRTVREGCQYAVIEMTSQGALLFRHRFIDIDTLIFTNISPEHIEAHGSYEKYLDAKLSIARHLARSTKPTTLIINADDAEAPKFVACGAAAGSRVIEYRLRDVEPYALGVEKDRAGVDTGIEFTWRGTKMRSPLSGLFNLYNILGAATCAEGEGVATAVIAEAIAKFGNIPGRVQKIDVFQDFDVIVDYAHTPDSLEKLYKVYEGRHIIGVLGGTGGGRDTWKRTEMGRIADRYCASIILTDEDPYDESPLKIVADVASGISTKKPDIIMDRREAIRAALSRAGTGSVVLITGKGTDPYIMGPHGTKTPWSDAQVAQEELAKISHFPY